MRFFHATCLIALLSASLYAQQKNAAPRESKSVTVPATIDHNRVVIEVGVPTPNGTPERVRAWIDTGTPELVESPHVGALNGKGFTCIGPCSTEAPTGVVVAEMNLPSSILRHYDVLIDFPGRKVTIGTPGSIHFNGVPAKVKTNPANGLISVPSKIENKKYDLELDLGSPMSLLPAALFEALAAAHPDWPHMIGAVGSANECCGDQLKRKVVRLDRLQFGPLFLADVAVGDWATEKLNLPANVEYAGLLGAEALQNYRIGLDYAHSTVYFDLGRTFNFPDFDVIGLILRPEDDGGFTILGVADFDGKPSVVFGPDGVQAGDQLLAVDGIPVRGSTMGQVWSMLGGTPGQERVLTIQRAGRGIRLVATVQHFLPEAPDEKESK
jgi:hypothetical protein